MTPAEKKDFFLFGAAAFGKVALDAALLSGWTCRGVFDDDTEKHGGFLLPGFAVAGSRTDMEKEGVRLGVRNVLVAVGTNGAREKMTAYFRERGFNPICVRHPGANISAMAGIAQGVTVMSGVNVEAMAEVGEGALLNTASLVAHDCRVGAFCHVAVGAVLAGCVKLGDRTFIGAGAVVRPGISICADVTVGAGAAVVKDITEPGAYAGVPARRLENKNEKDENVKGDAGMKISPVDGMGGGG